MQILKEETAAMTLMVCLVNLPDKAQSVAQMLDAWLVASLSHVLHAATCSLLNVAD